MWVTFILYVHRGIETIADSILGRQAWKRDCERVWREDCGGHAVGFLAVVLIRLAVDVVLHSSVSLEELQRRFGEESIWVYNIIRVKLRLRSLDSHAEFRIRVLILQKASIDMTTKSGRRLSC